ncbi:MAG TPA: DUF6084 family protein [Thermoanaerobaculia bacterium]|nr:DUF6084 family protein [Thermoanaerobaculia bacterium]
MSPGSGSAGAAASVEAEVPPRLALRVTGAEVDVAAATPTIALELAVAGPADRRIDSVLLQAQVRIAPRRRSYDPAARERLRELFGAPEQWNAAMTPLVWTRATLVVPRFIGETTSTVALPCSYDFEVAAAKYLSALGAGSGERVMAQGKVRGKVRGKEQGTVPLELLFRGTIFYPGAGGVLRAAMLPWDLETRYDLPVELWRSAVDRFFPDAAWLRLSRDRFDLLAALKARLALSTWDAVIDALLAGSAEQGVAGNRDGHDGDGGPGAEGAG